MKELDDKPFFEIENCYSLYEKAKQYYEIIKAFELTAFKLMIGIFSHIATVTLTAILKVQIIKYKNTLLITMTRLSTFIDFLIILIFLKEESIYKKISIKLLSS